EAVGIGPFRHHILLLRTYALCYDKTKGGSKPVLRLRTSRFQPAAASSGARWSGRMRKLAALAVLFAVLALPLPLRPGIPVPVHAQPYDEELRQLLEKSLTLTELDREIERIGA